MSLLQLLRKQGVEIRIVKGRAIYNRRVVTPALLEEMRLCKAETLAELGEESKPPKPYVSRGGDLVIPFNAARMYHWWNGGQSILDTLQELGAAADVVRRYVADAYDDKQRLTQRN